jgi:sulfotransferase family protein
MTSEGHPSRFVVLSLPRSGSTTLARLLNCHKDIRCLIEPFHPKRYAGKFYNAAADERSLDSVLNAIWSKCNGIKHVWESSGWPFEDRPELNDRIVLGPNRRLIFMIRRNLLRRIVSNFISRQTKFWIGTKEEFHERLQSVQLRELSPETVLKQIRSDREAIAHRLESFADRSADVMTLYYEDVFREDASQADQFDVVNSTLEFLGFSQLTLDVFAGEWQHHFDPALNQWASAEVYRRIPGIDRIEEQVGSDESGWLFR